jgi:hypothetical protein
LITKGKETEDFEIHAGKPRIGSGYLRYGEAEKARHGRMSGKLKVLDMAQDY